MNSSSSRMSPRTSWGFASCDFSCSTIMLLMFTPSVAGGRGRPSPGSRRPMLDVGYRSFRTETGRLYDGWPSFSFPLHERICLDRGRGPCLDTYLGQRLDDFALFERLLQCDIELLDHGRGRSFGRGEAAPVINVEAGPHSLGQGWDIRVRRRAVASRSGKCSNLVFRCQRQCPDDTAESQLDIAGHQIAERAGYAGIRHVDCFHAGAALEQLGRQMRCAPDAGRGKTQLVRILGPVIDQLVDAFHRQMVRGDDDHGGGTNHSDHREVGHSVTRIVAQHRVNNRAGIDENERVPIGSRMCDRRGSIDPGCSRSVFRNDGISAEYLAQPLSDDASREVGNSARRKAKDQVNGLRGELLCLRLKIEGPSNRHTAEQSDELAPLHRADPKPKEHGEYSTPHRAHVSRLTRYGSRSGANPPARTSSRSPENGLQPNQSMSRATEV